MSLFVDACLNSVVLQLLNKKYTFLAYHAYSYIFVDKSPNIHHIIFVDTYYGLIHLLSFDMMQIYALYNLFINMSYSLFV